MILVFFTLRFTSHAGQEPDSRYIEAYEWSGRLQGRLNNSGEHLTLKVGCKRIYEYGRSKDGPGHVPTLGNPLLQIMFDIVLAGEDGEQRYRG